MDKRKTKTSISVKMKGLEPVFTIHKNDGKNTSTNIVALFYPFRRLHHKIKCNRKYKELKRLGIDPHKCEGCGEGWAEFVIEDPNEEHGTYKKLFVCQSCVYFYDWKRSFKRLYNNPTDWRDSTERFMKESPIFNMKNGR